MERARKSRVQARWRLELQNVQRMGRGEKVLGGMWVRKLTYCIICQQIRMPNSCDTYGHNYYDL